MVRKKHYTVIIVPERASTLFKLKFSNHSLYILTALILATFIISGYMFYNYIDVRSRYVEMGDLSEQNRQLKEELKGFEKTYETLSARMDKIKGFDEKIRDLADIDEYTEEKTLFGIGGPIPGGKEKSSLDDRTSALFDELNSEIERLSEVANHEEQSLNELLSFLEEQENLLASTPSIWPTRGFVTSGFGFRGRRMHEGLDIANRVGTRINASADGIVIFAGIRSGYGKFLIIDHGYGISTCYGHLNSIDAREGQRLKRGERLGTIGNTGRSTGPHLHYEVRINGVPVNPVNYILN
ncbi:MAG: peptidoglycan DD-metalloendopeptidase family protein [Deltaproteobacteria bacterium]|uniref:Peptidoglycan DD-metalloendopeptidase family protein n=1 Tax=Candidatus Zymogenus saltonus TaxID=2844893 RepID=A0A9D8KD48_9DELT|nr:peptidoglycan DD-metalloendopeptidase family protein [Candidatus Zymogenus saltonus]